MDITNKTVEELKVLAYDAIAMQQQAQANLATLNAEIGKRLKPTSSKDEDTENILG